jgi:3-dehydroquinate dehydratase type I
MSQLVDRIVGVVAESTIVVSLEQFRQLPEEILLVEWRLDYLNKLNEQAIVEAIKLVRQKVIVTLRSVNEGGRFDGDEDKRTRLLQELSGLKNTIYIDIDISNKMLVEKIVQEKRLLSYHNFERTPTMQELNDLIEIAKQHSPSIIKIACRVSSSAESARLFSLFTDYPKQNFALIPMSGDDDGLRVEALKRGSALMFVATGSSVAPGQMSVDAMLEVIERGE